MRRCADPVFPARVATRARGLFALAAFCFGMAWPADAQVIDPGTVVQTIETSLWSPPSPDPAGIGFRPETGELVACDSEVDEMTLFAGANLWTHSSSGVVASTATTTGYSSEPSGIAFDPAGGRLWISDDNRSRIFEIDFGADGIWGSSDDSMRDLDGLVAAGCNGFKDVAYDNLDGHLYVVGDPAQEVCKIDPGPDGIFNGAAPTGDDVVTTFSVAPYGILKPEGIVYDPLWDTLVIADRGTRDLYELTPEGGLLRQIDVNFPSGTRPSGVTIAPGSANPMLRSYWVTDRGLDNNIDPLENDGRIFEVVAIPLGGNSAPIVDAGQPQIIEWPADSVDLAGVVSDDGHPSPPGLVLAQWSQLSGPGSVTFGDASSPATTASFSAPGDYVLQLLGDDSEEQTVDTVAISLNQSVTLSVSAAGPGSVTLDPPGGTYPAGSSVTVTAVPDPDSAFTGWSGDLAGATSPESILMDADKSVTASFATLYDVSVQSSGPGSVTLDPPGGTYAAGSVVTVTATPDANAVFDGFGGALAGTSSPQQLSVDGDQTVTASFHAIPTHTLSVTTQGEGSVTLDPPGGSYAAGSEVTLTAVPSPNRLFDHWSGDASGSDNPLSLSMDADKSVTAHFVSTGGGGTACGIGPELAALLPALAWLYRRRRRGA